MSPSRRDRRRRLRSQPQATTPEPSAVLYAVIDDSLSPTSPVADSVDLFVRQEEAERFSEEVRGDDHEIATKLRVEERELDGSGLN